MALLNRLFNGPSKHQDTVYVRTTKLKYFPGEVVAGELVLIVTKPLKVDMILLKIRGTEEVSFKVVQHYRADKNKTETRVIPIHKKISLYEHDRCVIESKSKFRGGRHAFSFQFILDDGIPGTFNMSKDGRTAKIRHEIEARVLMPGFLKSDLTYQHEFTVISPLVKDVLAIKTSQENMVSFLCCLSRGSVSTTAFLDKNAYKAGETAQLRLLVDTTQSRVDHKQVSFELVQKLRLQASGHTSLATSSKTKLKSFGIKGGEIADRYIEIMLPETCEPSMKGRLFDCDYEIVVELDVPWSMDLAIRQPIEIYSRELSFPACNPEFPGNVQSDWFLGGDPPPTYEMPQSVPPSYQEYYGDNSMSELPDRDTISLDLDK